MYVYKMYKTAPTSVRVEGARKIREILNRNGPNVKREKLTVQVVKYLLCGQNVKNVRK